MWKVVGLGIAALLVTVSAQGQSAKALSKNDHTEIHELYARYAQSIDRSDAAGYGGVFTEDGVFIIDDPTHAVSGNATFTGRKAIAALVRNPPRDHPKVTHFYSNILVEPTPDGAKGSDYVIMIDLQKNPAITGGGVCEDDLVRTSEGWRFKKRVCSVEPGPPKAANQTSSR